MDARFRERRFTTLQSIIARILPLGKIILHFPIHWARPGGAPWDTTASGYTGNQVATRYSI